MLTKTTDTKSKADNLFCLQPAALIDDGNGRVEIRIAAGILCPHCRMVMRNYPDETAHGWRLVCLSCHQDIITVDRQGSGSFADFIEEMLNDLGDPQDALEQLDAVKAAILADR
jgi:hypothetical protein